MSKRRRRVGLAVLQAAVLATTITAPAGADSAAPVSARSAAAAADPWQQNWAKTPDRCGAIVFHASNDSWTLYDHCRDGWGVIGQWNYKHVNDTWKDIGPMTLGKGRHRTYQPRDLNERRWVYFRVCLYHPATLPGACSGPVQWPVNGG